MTTQTTPGLNAPGPTKLRAQSAFVRRPTGTAFRTEHDRSGPYSLNMHGSRGADLLEMLRLDTLSGNSREAATRHPAVDSRGEVLRQPASTRSKPWLEAPAKFVRPKSAAARSKCTVYSSKLLQELLPQEETGEDTAAPERLDSPARPPSVVASLDASAVPGRVLPARRRPASAQPVNTRPPLLPIKLGTLLLLACRMCVNKPDSPPQEKKHTRLPPCPSLLVGEPARAATREAGGRGIVVVVVAVVVVAVICSSNSSSSSSSSSSSIGRQPHLSR